MPLDHFILHLDQTEMNDKNQIACYCAWFLYTYCIRQILLMSEQVAQQSQRDRATHELLRFAKLRSGIFELPFGGLGGR